MATLRTRGGTKLTKKVVDALAAEARGADRLLHPHGDAEDVRSRLLVEVGQQGRMLACDEQDVARRDRIQVHEADDALVLVHDARLAPSGQELAEEALAHVPTTRAPVRR